MLRSAIWDYFSILIFVVDSQLEWFHGDLGLAPCLMTTSYIPWQWLLLFADLFEESIYGSKS